MISKRLLGVEVSAKTVTNSLSVVEERAKDLLQRPLLGRYWAIYVDGTNFSVQRRGPSTGYGALLGARDAQRLRESAGEAA